MNLLDTLLIVLLATAGLTSPTLAETPDTKNIQAVEKNLSEAGGKTERSTYTAPFLESLRAELGDSRFELGPVEGAAHNTLIIQGGRRVSIPIGTARVRRLAILHTTVRLHGVANCQVELKYKGVDKPDVRQWAVHDWQARSKALPDKEIASGLWWYRRDKGLVTTDTNARVYVHSFEVDSSRRVESIVLVTPKLSRPEVRIYAVSALETGSKSWKAIDLTKLFNTDTILSEAKGPADEKVYFATAKTVGLGRTEPAEAVADSSTEIRRTKPDFTLHDPTSGKPHPWNDPDLFWLNEHLLVQPNGKGELLAMWTSERLKPWKWSIKYAHSKDGGSNWSDAKVLDGPKASWQVPVISPKRGRIYVFNTHGFLYGGMRCRTSDDGGHTWSQPVELQFAKGLTDHPGQQKKASWISPTIPHWDRKGRPLIGFTRWATHPEYPGGVAGHSQVEYFRIENLDENLQPKDLKITWLNLDDPITVPHKTKKGFSYAQEPYTVDLPDGRLFVVVRTDSGHIWYSVSSDDGETWRQAEPLRYRDGGEIMKNPVSPCPIFQLERGDYVLLYNNNDGTGQGLKGPEDRAARRPAYLARGEFRPQAHQPIWFSEPKLFVDNDSVRWGPPGRERLEAATYTSLTDINGRRVLWYPDRKSFLLGKLIPDSLLDRMAVPK